MLFDACRYLMEVKIKTYLTNFMVIYYLLWFIHYPRSLVYYSYPVFSIHRLSSPPYF